jgi:hypothetical protein
MTVLARAAVDQIIQIGAETVPGTRATKMRRLPGISIDIKPSSETQRFRVMGYNVDTTSIIQKQWAPGTWNGPVDFNQIVFPLSGLIGLIGAAPVALGSGYVWDFNPVSAGADPFPTTFSIEYGDSIAAMLALQAQFSSFTLEWTNDNLAMSGNIFSRYPTDSQVLTGAGNVTVVAQRPASRMQVDLYIDDTVGALGTTKAAAAYEGSLSVADKFVPFWALNTDYPSYADTVRQAAEVNGSMSMSHNAQSRALYTSIVNNPTKYIRMLITGAALGGGATEQIRVDYAARFAQPEIQKDANGILGFKYNFNVIHDETLGGAYKIRVINGISAVIAASSASLSPSASVSPSSSASASVSPSASLSPSASRSPSASVSPS